MKTLTKFSLTALMGITSLMSSVGTVVAQENNFPNKSLTYIVPFPLAGPTDVSGRILAEALGKELKQTVVVENKSGASGTIGIRQLIRSKPDGYTFATLVAPSLTAPFILPSAPYDLNKDVKPVGLAYITPIVLVVNPQFTPNIKDIKSLVAAAKASPTGLNYATASVGSTAHLSMELIKKDLGIQLTHVPFRGSAPAMTALLAGDITFMYSDLVAVLGQIKAGKLYPIVVNTKERLAELPNTPTLLEENIQAAKAASWGGLVVPKNTPDSAVAVLSDALKKVLENPEVASKLKANGFYTQYGDAKAMKEAIYHDSKLWESVIEENNLRQAK